MAKKIQLTTNVDNQNVNVYPVTKPEFVEFSDGKTLNDKLNNIDNNHNHGLATPTKDGFMSKEDKAKLDGVTNYTHPNSHAATMITEDSNHRFVTDADKTKWNNKADNTMANKTNAGLMSASDKQRIDGLNAEFKTRDDKITKNTEDIKSWNDEMINKEYQYFNGQDITIDNSIVSKTTDMVIKGRTLNNLYKTNNVREDAGGKYILVDTLVKDEPKDRVVYIVNNTNKILLLNVYKIDGGWDSNPIIRENSITKLDLIGKRLTGFLGMYDRGWANNEANKEELRNTCIVLDREETYIPQEYFEGIKSFGQQEDKISILSNGKNFINLNERKLQSAQITITDKKANEVTLESNSNNGYIYINLFDIKVSKNTNYVVGCKFENIIDGKYRALKIFGNSTNILLKEITNNDYRVINTGDNENLQVYLYTNRGSNITGNDTHQKIRFYDIMIAEGSDVNSYTPYQEDKKDILLSELGFDEGLSGLSPTSYDELNNKKNIAIKRISKIIFNGTENNGYSIEDKGDNWKFGIRIPDAKPESTEAICNTFRNMSTNMDEKKVEGIRLYTHNSSNIELRFAINKTKLTIEGDFPTNNDIKNFFKSNPTIVYYELANPIEIEFKEEDIDLKTYNEKTYITTNNSIKGNLSFTAPMNTAANLENNSSRLNNIENYINDNKNNIDKISKLEEGAVTSSLNIIDLQKDIKNDNDYTHYEGTNITIDNLSKDSRTSNMIIKGKTLQNIFPTDPQKLGLRYSTIEGPIITMNPIAGSWSNAFDPDNTLWKTNTKYTVIIDIIENTLVKTENSAAGSLIVGNETTESVFDSFQLLLINVDNNAKGIYKKVLTTQKSFDSLSRNQGARIFLTNTYSGGQLKFKVMILEGDWTNKRIPDYFEGIKSVGETEQEGDKYKVSILNNGKNLLKPPLEEQTLPLSYNSPKVTITTDGKYILNGASTITGGRHGFIGLIPTIMLRKGKKYKLSGIDSNNVILWISKVSDKSPLFSNKSDVYTAIEDTEVFFGINYAVTTYNNFVILPQLEEDTVVTKYETYKENKKVILLKEPLRENDYLYEENKQIKVHKKRNKYTFTGNEAWTPSTETQDNILVFYCIFNDTINNTKLICNNFATIDYDLKGIEGITNNKGVGTPVIRIKILKSKLSQQNVEGFKTWLKNNPTTIIYELAEPKTEIVSNDDLNLEVYKEKSHINCLNNIQGELSFNVPNNLVTQIKENTDNINKNFNSIDCLNDKTSKLESAQVATALNVLELQKHTAMLNNGEINEYKDHIGTFVECNNTLDSRTEGMIIKGQTLHNIHKKQNYSFSTNLNSESYDVNLNNNSCEVKIKNYEPEKYYYINGGLINFPLLKPNTVYSVIADATDGLDPCIRTPSYIDPLTKTSTVFKNGIATITTNDLSAGYKEQVLYITLRKDMLNEFQRLKNAMILEGDWTNKNIPEYFESIRSIGEAECNILNETQILPGYIGGDDGITLNLNTNENTRIAIVPCEPDTTYTITKEYKTDRFVIGTTNNNPIAGTKVTKLSIDTKKSVSVTTPKDAKYLLAYITINVKTQPYGKININKSCKTKEWSIPNKYKIDVLSHNKNLIDFKEALNELSIPYTIEDEGYKLTANAKLYRGFFYPKNSTKQHSISLDVKAITITNFRCEILYSDGTISSTQLVNSSNDFIKIKAESIPGKVISYIRMNWTNAGELIIKNLQIEEGKTTIFEAYRENKTNVFIKEPLRSNDNVSDIIYEENREVKANRFLGEYIFTGDEGWTLGTQVQGWGEFDDTLVFYLDPFQAKVNTRFICNNFAYKNVVNTNEIGIYNNVWGNKPHPVIRIEKSKLTTPNLEGFKTWLKANPTTIIYELVEPVTEIVDSIDINVDTYKDKTYVTTDNEIQGELEFKTQNNFGAIMKNVNRCISKIFNSLNNILNIKGE